MNNLNRFIIGLGILLAGTPAAFAQGTDTPLGRVSNFGELVSLIWAYGSNVIIGLAVFMVVLGALFYVTSAGNEERITEGKDMVVGSLIAIVIVMLSGVLIRTLHKPAEGTTGALSDVPNVIQNATNILIGLIGTFSVIMFAYAGILYILGRGDESRIDKAHRAFRYAAIGLVVGVLAYAIVNTVIRFLL